MLIISTENLFIQKKESFCFYIFNYCLKIQHKFYCSFGIYQQDIQMDYMSYTQQSSYVPNVTTSTVSFGNKFQFSSHDLARKVRRKMREHLHHYDYNRNMEFEKDEIEKMLVELLGQNENQLRYVINNVFRYDKNNDGSVTFEQFTNFATETHFGQMALQRLHRDGWYSQGSKRIMNQQQFCKTLAYSLDKIRAPGTNLQYCQLFEEVDKDHDGWITYEDYFHFLREYFGSNSIAAQQQKKIEIEVPLPITQPLFSFKDGNGETPQQRIAKLIYSQLKISVMLFDKRRNLKLEPDQIEDIVENIFQVRGQEKFKMTNFILRGRQSLTYENFMQIIVQLFLCEIIINTRYPNLQKIEAGSFAVLFCKFIFFVDVKPAQHVLNELFRKYDTDQDGYISLEEYQQMIYNIFQNYQFDKRGLPRF